VRRDRFAGPAEVGALLALVFDVTRASIAPLSRNLSSRIDSPVRAPVRQRKLTRRIDNERRMANSS